MKRSAKKKHARKQALPSSDPTRAAVAAIERLIGGKLLESRPRRRKVAADAKNNSQGS